MVPNDAGTEAYFSPVSFHLLALLHVSRAKDRESSLNLAYSRIIINHICMKVLHAYNNTGGLECIKK